MRLVLSILAREDLAEISSHKLLLAVRASCHRLCTFPAVGRLRNELSPGLRSYPVGPFVIFYRIKPDAVVFINRVLHGKRDVAPLLKR